MDVEAVIGRVKQILVDEFELSEDAIHPDASIREDLQLDSLDGMDLIVMIEREFGFRVDEKRLMRLRTVGEVYEYVREACVEQAAAPKPVATLAVEPPADL